MLGKSVQQRDIRGDKTSSFEILFLRIRIKSGLYISLPGSHSVLSSLPVPFDHWLTTNAPRISSTSDFCCSIGRNSIPPWLNSDDLMQRNCNFCILFHLTVYKPLRLLSFMVFWQVLISVSYSKKYAPWSAKWRWVCHLYHNVTMEVPTFRLLTSGQVGYKYLPCKGMLIF